MYQAVNKGSGVEAALKRVLIDNACEIGDYVVEIEILSICDHPNIVMLMDSYYYGSQISVRNFIGILYMSIVLNCSTSTVSC